MAIDPGDGILLKPETPFILTGWGEQSRDKINLFATLQSALHVLGATMGAETAFPSRVTAPLTTAHAFFTAMISAAMAKLRAAGSSRRTAHHVRRAAALAAANITLWATAAIRAANMTLWATAAIIAANNSVPWAGVCAAAG